MKAVMYSEYGAPNVLRLREIAKPNPQDNEILIRIRATPVNYGDLIARNFKNVSSSEFNMPLPFYYPARFAFGFNKPKATILGNEFAGIVEAIGKDVRQFAIGDAVFGYRGASMGANVEYLCMAEDALVTKKPSNMSFEEIATVPYGALTALTLLRKVTIQQGDKVLIIGASGAIGSYALQLAKHYGAEVTGVCGTARVEMVKALGADRVIDYTKEDFAEIAGSYDLIFDVLGRTGLAKCKRALTANGSYLLASFKMKHVFQMLWTSRVGSKKVICALSNETRDDLIHIRELVEEGALKTVIDRCYPLAQAAEAHAYIENGHKTGHVVLTI